MKIFTEKSLSDFEFWSGASERVENLTDSDFQIIERELEDMYPDGIDETELNDIFWFDFDKIAQMLGYDDEEDFDKKRSPDYYELSDEEFADYADIWLKDVLVKRQEDCEFLGSLLKSFDLYDCYDDCYPDDAEYWQNGPQMADFILKSWENGDIDVVACLFDEDNLGHTENELIPTTEEMREMAIEYYKNSK